MSKRESVSCSLIYDARGNGGGTIAPTITGDHQSRITDYTAIVLQGMENGFLYRERTSTPAISASDSRSAELSERSAENLEGGGRQWTKQ